MGIFKRAGDIISANLNELVDKFEDPEKMLRQAIREMESSIATATTAAARSIAGEKILVKQRTQHCEQATQWRTRAKSALAAGDEELARQAIRREQEHEKLDRALADQVEAAENANGSLRRQIEAMRAKHAEAKRKLYTLLARKKAADARLLWPQSTAVSSFSGDAAALFDRMCDRVEEAEAEADARVELYAGEEERLFAVLESREDQLAVEAELTTLKQELAKSN